MQTLIERTLLLGATLLCCGATLMADEPSRSATKPDIFAGIGEPQATDAAATKPDETAGETIDSTTTEPALQKAARTGAR